MYRLDVTGFRTHTASLRVRIGSIYKYDDDEWVIYSAGGTPSMHWYCAGKAMAKLPGRVVNYEDMLHSSTDLLASGLLIPDVIDVKITEEMDTLVLPQVAVVGIYSKQTGLVVNPTITYGVDTLSIDVSALSGSYRIFLDTMVTSTYETSIANQTVTLSKEWFVHGFIDEDTGIVSKPWTSITYTNGNTIVAFTNSDQTGRLIYSPAIFLSAYLASPATSIKIPTECPASFITDENVYANSTISIFNGFTTVHLGDIPLGLNRVALLAWTYNLLTTAYGSSGGMSGSSTPAPTVSPSGVDYYKGYFNTLALLLSAYPTANRGDWAWIGGDVNRPAVWNSTTNSWVVADSNLTDMDLMLTRAGSVTAYKVYAYIEGVWTLADITNESVSECMLYMAKGTDAAVNGMTSDGIVSNISWSWTTPDKALYLTTAGGLTETIPDSVTNAGEVARIVAHVISATQIRFRGYIPGLVFSAVS